MFDACYLIGYLITGLPKVVEITLTELGKKGPEEKLKSKPRTR